MTDDKIARRCFEAKQRGGMILIRDVISIVREAEKECKSGTCENCKWYRHIGEGVKECKLYDIAFGDTFGCPKFERKER